MSLNDNIIKRSERLLFGVIDEEFINIYSPDNPQKISGDVVYFLFTNTLDIHRPLIGKGVIIYDRYSSDMLKIYSIELQAIMEEASTVNRYFNNKKFEIVNINNDSRVVNMKMINEFLDTQNNDMLTHKLFRINSFFVRDSIAKIHELRLKYCSIIQRDIEAQYYEVNEIIENGNDINPHRYVP